MRWGPRPGRQLGVRPRVDQGMSCRNVSVIQVCTLAEQLREKHRQPVVARCTAGLVGAALTCQPSCRPRLQAVVKLADNFNGADLRNICTEAGMFAIRDERDYVIQVRPPNTAGCCYGQGCCTACKFQLCQLCLRARIPCVAGKSQITVQATSWVAEASTWLVASMCSSSSLPLKHSCSALHTLWLTAPCLPQKGPMQTAHMLHMLPRPTSMLPASPRRTRRRTS